MNNKLKVKDFISIGIFAAVYIVIFMLVVTASGMVPLLYFFSPAINAILLAPIFMLFVARTPKKNAIFIMGLISGGVVCLMMPPLWPIYAFTIVAMVLAEIFVRKAKFHDFKRLTLAYVFFANWVMGVFVSWFVYSDVFFARMEGYPEDYVKSIQAILRPEILGMMFLAVILGAVIGSFLAKSILKKHFKKAGII